MHTLPDSHTLRIRLARQPEMRALLNTDSDDAGDAKAPTKHRIRSIHCERFKRPPKSGLHPAFVILLFVLVVFGAAVRVLLDI